MQNSLRCKLRSDKLLFFLITQFPQALRITTTPANAPAINKFPVCYFAVELTLCCVTFLCYVTFLRRVMLLHCVTLLNLQPRFLTIHCGAEFVKG